jgi:sulfonate transport system permease protein
VTALRRGHGAGVALSTYTTRVRTRTSVRWLLVGAVVLAGVWELASIYVAHHFRDPNQVLPSIQQVMSDFRSLSDYWNGGLGIPAPSNGGRHTYAGAILALADGALTTTLRLVVGYVIATVVGISLGLLIGWSRTARRFMLGPIALVAAMPLLALLPLFAFWFGATTTAAIAVIAFGCGNTILRSTGKAIDNVPSRYLKLGQTLGANRLQLYRRVVLPAILPELRGGMTVALTFSWSLALAAELLGVQGGLGAMMSSALQFSEIGRMVFIAGTFVVLAAGTVLGFGALTSRILRWMP